MQGILDYILRIAAGKVVSVVVVGVYGLGKYFGIGFWVVGGLGFVVEVVVD